MSRFFLSVLLGVIPAIAQTGFYRVAIDQDRLSGAPDFSSLNHPLTAADRLFVRDGHFYRVGPDLKPGRQMTSAFASSASTWPSAPISPTRRTRRGSPNACGVSVST